MSAFIVSDTHINALVSYATGGGPFRVSDGNPQELGQMLVNENYRSVNYRYRERDEPHTFRYRPYIKPLKPVEVIKLCDCYDYQSCETDDYEKSEAYRLIQGIRSKALHLLPGYADAPWGLDDEHTHTVERIA